MEGAKGKVGEKWRYNGVKEREEEEEKQPVFFSWKCLAKKGLRWLSPWKCIHEILIYLIPQKPISEGSKKIISTNIQYLPQNCFPEWFCHLIIKPIQRNLCSALTSEHCYTDGWARNSLSLSCYGQSKNDKKSSIYYISMLPSLSDLVVKRIKIKLN